MQVYLLVRETSLAAVFCRLQTDHLVSRHWSLLVIVKATYAQNNKPLMKF